MMMVMTPMTMVMHDGLSDLHYSIAFPTSRDASALNTKRQHMNHHFLLIIIIIVIIIIIITKIIVIHCHHQVDEQ